MLKNIEHLQPGCPWYDLSEILLPNVKWCEANLCSWIINPANTWSNLGYIFVGLYFLFLYQKKSREQYWLGMGVVVVGVTSFIHHAAYNFFTQLLDFIGMYYYLLFVFLANFVRLGNLGADKLIKIWASSVTFLTILTVIFYFLEIPIQVFVPVVGLAIFFQERKIFNSTHAQVKLNASPDLNNFYTALGLLVLAATCSALDAKRIWCDPNNHWIQGHAAWHVISSVGLYFLTLHMLKVKPFMESKS